MDSRSSLFADGRRRLRRAAAVWLPSTILVLVACTQMVFARTESLSAWKGGGFGMFASLDGLPFREVRVFVSSMDRSTEIPLPLSLEDAGARVAVFPRERALRTLAQAVIDEERAGGRSVDAVRVEVWATRLSPALDSTAVKLRDLSLRVDAIGDRARR